MKCPVCSCRLRQVKSRNVEIYICSNCTGVWFDSGELQIFLHNLVKRQEISPEPTRLFTPRDVETTDYSVAEKRICPKCGVVMRTFNYAYDSNVFVDKCPQCEGIWTDAGEAKRLARYLKTDPKAALVAQHIAKRQQHLDELKDLQDLSHALRRNAWAASSMPNLILPVGDDIDREKYPIVTLSIIVSCIAVFSFEFFGVHDIENFVNRYGFIPSDFFSIGLITSMFLHGGFFHLLGNMYFLWIFGDNVEDRFGYVWYLLFYLGADIAANIIYTIFHMGSTIPCIGASGAISGVMGAYSVFYPNAKLKMLIFYHLVPVPASIYLSIWFLMQISYSVIAFQSGDYGVAWLAHVGGFVFGMAAAYLVKKCRLTDTVSNAQEA